MSERALESRLAVYQNACFKGDKYVGFQCVHDCKICPLKKGGGLDIKEGFARVNEQMELHHLPGHEFRKTHTTYPNQVVPLCEDCHKWEHIGDPSADRLPS